MDKVYTIGFTTTDFTSWQGLNDKRMFMDYEENVIESYNFEGFAEQLMAIWMGWTDGVELED